MGAQKGCSLCCTIGKTYKGDVSTFSSSLSLDSHLTIFITTNKDKKVLVYLINLRPKHLQLIRENIYH